MQITGESHVSQEPDFISASLFFSLSPNRISLLVHSKWQHMATLPSQLTVIVLAICRDWIVVSKFQIPRRAYDWPCLAQVSNHPWPSWLVYPVNTAPWMKGNYRRRGDGSWIWKIVLEFIRFTIWRSWCLEPQKSQINCIPRAVK